MQSNRVYKFFDLNPTASLVSYIRRVSKKFDEKLIRFSIITKNSNAHHIAIETFREEHKPNEVLTEKQIWRLLK